MQCKRKVLKTHVSKAKYGRILFCKSNSVITSFSFVSKQGVSSKNGSSLASLCFNGLRVASGEKRRRKIYKIEHPESILPVKSTNEKTRSIFHGKRMRPCKACPVMLVRYNHHEKSAAR